MNSTRNNRIVPQRIKEAREYRLMSATELADKVGKSRQAISQFENGVVTPSAEIIMHIATVTNFPVQFFTHPMSVQNNVASEITLYRGSLAKTKRLKRSYSITSKWVNDLINYLKSYVQFFDVAVPFEEIEFDFDEQIDLVNKIESVADHLRTYWKLGRGPIRDIVGILENNGFIISKIPQKAKEVDAFSQWFEGTPYIFYEGNRDTNASYVFSICHELGHLILHQSISEKYITKSENYKLLEDEANIFAGAFLMPADTFGNEYLTSNLNSFLMIKKRWNVSLGAMIMRAFVLGIIDDQQKKYLYRQLSGKGYRKKEPFDECVSFQPPSILYNSIKMLLDKGIICIQDLLDAVPIPSHELSALCSFPPDFIVKYQLSARNIPKLTII